MHHKTEWQKWNSVVFNKPPDYNVTAEMLKDNKWMCDFTHSLHSASSAPALSGNGNHTFNI